MDTGFRLWTSTIAKYYNKVLSMHTEHLILLDQNAARTEVPSSSNMGVVRVVKQLTPW